MEALSLEQRKKVFQELQTLYKLDDKEWVHLINIIMFLSVNKIPCDKSLSRVLSALAYWADSLDVKP